MFSRFYFSFFVLFFIVNFFSSADKKIEKINQISPIELNILLNEKSKDKILIDVRNGFEYDEESIPGSILINQDKITRDFSFYEPILKNKTIIIHCKSGARGAQTAKAIQKLTKNKVYNLKGGIQGWKKENLPTIKAGISIMRQVQIFAGTMVFIFALLGFFRDRKFLFINFFIGLGLLFAGLTGFCGAAIVMKMMPWNR